MAISGCARSPIANAETMSSSASTNLPAVIASIARVAMTW
jgi:hypothetical protein